MYTYIHTYINKNNDLLLSSACYVDDSDSFSVVSSEGKYFAASAPPRIMIYIYTHTHIYIRAYILIYTNIYTYVRTYINK